MKSSMPLRKGGRAGIQKGGRPSKYSGEQELRSEIHAYFDSCKQSKTFPNKAGLCVYLGISRETYNQYRSRFPDTIKSTDDYIEDVWIQRLTTNAPTGAIFYLKNAFGYRDRQEREEADKESLMHILEDIHKEATKRMEAERGH